MRKRVPTMAARSVAVILVLTTTFLFSEGSLRTIANTDFDEGMRHFMVALASLQDLQGRWVYYNQKYVNGLAQAKRMEEAASDLMKDTIGDSGSGEGRNYVDIIKTLIGKLKFIKEAVESEFGAVGEECAHLSPTVTARTPAAESKKTKDVLMQGAQLLSGWNADIMNLNKALKAALPDLFRGHTPSLPRSRPNRAIIKVEPSEFLKGQDLNKEFAEAAEGEHRGAMPPEESMPPAHLPGEATTKGTRLSKKVHPLDDAQPATPNVPPVGLTPQSRPSRYDRMRTRWPQTARELKELLQPPRTTSPNTNPPSSVRRKIEEARRLDDSTPIPASSLDRPPRDDAEPADASQDSTVSSLAGNEEDSSEDAQRSWAQHSRSPESSLSLAPPTRPAPGPPRPGVAPPPDVVQLPGAGRSPSAEEPTRINFLRKLEHLRSRTPKGQGGTRVRTPLAAAQQQTFFPRTAAMLDSDAARSPGDRPNHPELLRTPPAVPELGASEDEDSFETLQPVSRPPLESTRAVPETNSGDEGEGDESVRTFHDSDSDDFETFRDSNSFDSIEADDPKYAARAHGGHPATNTHAHAAASPAENDAASVAGETIEGATVEGNGDETDENLKPVTDEDDGQWFFEQGSKSGLAF